MKWTWSCIKFRLVKRLRVDPVLFPVNPIFNSPMYVRETDTVALMTDWFHTCFLPALADHGFLLLYNTHTQTHTELVTFQVHTLWCVPYSVNLHPKGKGEGWGIHRRTGLSSHRVVWAPEVPPGPLLFHEKRPWICTPANATQSQLGRHTRTHTHVRAHAHTCTTHARTHTLAHHVIIPLNHVCMISQESTRSLTSSPLSSSGLCVCVSKLSAIVQDHVCRRCEHMTATWLELCLVSLCNC